jgi:prepilin-type processing-associated H-X9-DG protein
LLPYIEQDATYKAMDLSRFYNDPVNQAAAKTQIGTYICPSASQAADPAGYGQISYMVISYTDVDPATGLRNATGLDAFGNPVRVAGALRIYGASGMVYDKNGVAFSLAAAPQFKTNAMKILDVKDGTSNTMIMGEDGPYRNHASVFPFQASTAKDPYVVAGGVDGAPTYVADGTGKRALNRWAEPEGSSNGVSGPPYADPASAQFPAGATSYAGPWVNQTSSPPGGTGTAPGQCTWAMNNCGPNDELFGPHTGGVVVGFADGHVGFLREAVSAPTIYRLIHPSDGVPPDTADAF